MNKQVEQIKTEIERLKESGCASPIVICDTLLSFIDFLQEEPVSEELLKELKGIVNIRECVAQGVPVIKIARHFANWQKEQMMKSAVERIVKVDAGGYPYILQMELYDYDKDIPLAKEGDKYKVILIKED